MCLKYARSTWTNQKCLVCRIQINNFDTHYLACCAFKQLVNRQMYKCLVLLISTLIKATSNFFEKSKHLVQYITYGIIEKPVYVSRHVNRENLMPLFLVYYYLN